MNITLNILNSVYLLIQKSLKANFLDINCNFSHVRQFLFHPQHLANASEEKKKANKI